MSKKERQENFIKQPELTESAKEAILQKSFILGEWPEEKWWEVFHSQELSLLIETALNKNPTIQAIEQRVCFAKQEAIVKGGKLFPLISFDAKDSIGWFSKWGLYRTLNPNIPTNGNDIDLGISFSYEFDFWNQYKNIYKAAKFRAQSDYAQSKEVELIISTSLAQAYFALKTNLTRKVLYQQLALVRKKYYTLQVLLNKKALLSKIAPTVSKESYLAAEKFVSQIDQEIAVVKHLINILRGAGPDEPLAIDEDQTDFTYNITIPKTLNLDLIARRPDLMAMILKTEALACDVGVAIADFYPNIDLKAFAGFESLIPQYLFNRQSQSYSLTPALHLPIYTAGAIQANIRGKKALYNQAVFEYNALLLKSTQEVSDILSILEDVFQKREFQESIVDQAQLRHKIVTHNYTKGLDNLLQVYETEEQVIVQSLENIALIYAQFASAIKLIKALGGGYNAVE